MVKCSTEWWGAGCRIDRVVVDSIDCSLSLHWRCVRVHGYLHRSRTQKTFNKLKNTQKWELRAEKETDQSANKAIKGGHKGMSCWCYLNANSSDNVHAVFFMNATGDLLTIFIMNFFACSCKYSALSGNLLIKSVMF